jgi:uncharacterized membrane protein
MAQATTVTALYDDLEEAQEAIGELIERGFDRDQVSLVVTEPAVGTSAREEEKSAAPVTADTAEGAVAGAVIGGIGGLLVGMAALAIPGIGTVVAAGAITNAIVGGAVGAGVGAVAGGLVGALIKMGVSEESARQYAEGVRRGSTLVLVQTEDTGQSELARRVLDRYNPVDMEDRTGRWRAEGWTELEVDAEPYPEEEISRERARYQQRVVEYRESREEQEDLGKERKKQREEMEERRDERRSY